MFHKMFVYSSGHRWVQSPEKSPHLFPSSLFSLPLLPLFSFSPPSLRSTRPGGSKKPKLNPKYAGCCCCFRSGSACRRVQCMEWCCNCRQLLWYSVALDDELEGAAAGGWAHVEKGSDCGPRRCSPGWRLQQRTRRGGSTQDP